MWRTEDLPGTPEEEVRRLNHLFRLVRSTLLLGATDDEIRHWLRENYQAERSDDEIVRLTRRALNR